MLRDLGFPISFAGISYQCYPKTPPTFSYVKDSVLEAAVLESFVLGIPTWFYSLKTS